MDAHDKNVLDKKINTAKKNTEYLPGASKEIGLDVITKRTKYLLNISLLVCGTI
jgi:hypothetical protein